MKVVFSRRAQRELDAAIAYIAKHDPDAAVRFVERVEAALAILADFPALGQETEAGVERKWSVPPYVMIYAVKRTLGIVRIVHARRNWRPRA